YKTEFLANMSHELRTPLNSLLLLAKLLADNPEANLSAKQIDFAETIHSAGSELLELINDILDLSKVEAGKMDVEAATVRTTTLCDAVAQIFGPLAEERGLSFEVTVANDVPAEFVTDEQRIQQVLKNLLSNAVKFTDSGEVRLDVTVASDEIEFTAPSLSAAPVVLAFSVSDTGIGVASDKLRMIFEAFQQADGTTSRRYGGTGLGLSISKELVRLLGGAIGVASAVGQGSTFTLYVPSVMPSEVLPSTTPGDNEGIIMLSGEPRAAASHRLAGMQGRQALEESRLAGGPATMAWPGRAGPGKDGPVRNGSATEEPGAVSVPVPAARRSSRSVPGATGPMATGTSFLTEAPEEFARREPVSGLDETDPLVGTTVLVVDDDVRNVFALTSALEMHGMRVLYADNGHDAIRLLQQEGSMIDLVLMDVMLPGLDGNETTSTIRQMPAFAALPIVVLTANAMPGDREKSFEAGATDYITKPVDLRHLLSAMRSHL
ncbi:ATP-binding protein, partial [Frankia sp. CiP1_Cm_nod2]